MKHAFPYCSATRSETSSFIPYCSRCGWTASEELTTSIGALRRSRELHGVEKCSPTVERAQILAAARSRTGRTRR